MALPITSKLEDNQSYKIEKEKRPIESMAKWISIVMSIFITIILVIVKIFVYEELPLGWIFSICGLFILIAVIMWYGNKIMNIFKDKDNNIDKIKLATADEIDMKAFNSLTNPKYFNHIKEVISCIPYSVGKSNTIIYVYHIIPLYGYTKYYIFINANNIDRLPGVLPDDGMSTRVLNTMINHMADVPLENPDIEETSVYNPMLGIETRVRKEQHRKKVKENKLKGDLE